MFVGVLVGGSSLFRRKVAGRSVCTRIMPHGSGMNNWDRVPLVSRLLVRVRLKKKASEIVCALRARYRRLMETFTPAFRISWCSFMSCDGRRQLSTSSRSGCVLACDLA